MTEHEDQVWQDISDRYHRGVAKKAAKSRRKRLLAGCLTLFAGVGVAASLPYLKTASWAQKEKSWAGDDYTEMRVDQLSDLVVDRSMPHIRRADAALTLGGVPGSTMGVLQRIARDAESSPRLRAEATLRIKQLLSHWRSEESVSAAARADAESREFGVETQPGYRVATTALDAEQRDAVRLTAIRDLAVLARRSMIALRQFAAVERPSVAPQGGNRNLADSIRDAVRRVDRKIKKLGLDSSSPGQAAPPGQGAAEQSAADSASADRKGGVEP